jgi:hypothetical protein
MDSAPRTSTSGSEKRQRTLEPKMRCTPGEYAQLCDAAESAGLTVAAFMRHQCLGTPGPRAARRPPVERLALAKLLAQLGPLKSELGKEGSNLNQIAHVLNAGGDVPSELSQVLHRHDQMLDEVKAVALAIREMLGVRAL